MRTRELQRLAVMVADELERRGMVAAPRTRRSGHGEAEECEGAELMDRTESANDGASSSDAMAERLLATIRQRPKPPPSATHSTGRSSATKPHSRLKTPLQSTSAT